jgi:hypothetical protein
VPDIAYDIKDQNSSRTGWFRFSVPPGLNSVNLPSSAKNIRGWLDGKEMTFRDGKLLAGTPPAGRATVAIRLEMEPGEYEGAAFPSPLQLELAAAAQMPQGDWRELGLQNYSGIGIYRQTFTLSPAETTNETALDLGEAGVSAEVFVNGKSAGVRMCKPFKFNLTGLLIPGENRLEIRVANTLAPFMSTSPIASSRALDSAVYGLKDPVQILQSPTRKDK